MAKQKSISQLKKELDRVYSIYIRTQFADDNGYTSCFTCGIRKHYKELHCGHFMSRRHLSTRWEYLNTRPQCYRCNINLSGNQYQFGLNLDAVYGEGTAESMQQLSKQEFKIGKIWLREQIEHYKSLI